MIDKNNKVRGNGDFILMVVEDYRDSYAVEICRALSIFKVIDYVLLTYPYITKQITIQIASDYQGASNIV